MATPSGPSNFEDHTSSDTLGTPGTPGSDESVVPEEYYILRDIICPELFREQVPRNTSVLQGEDWVAEIMTTPHMGRFYDNIRMTKPCFYALVDALTSRAMAYRRYLDSVGFEQMEGWSFEVEQRFMFWILDDNTRVPMCNDNAAELAMERWTRALRRHFRRRFTVSEVRTKFYEFKERYNTYTALTSNPGIWYDYETDEMHFPLAMRESMTARFPMAPRYFVYTEPAYNNMLEIWGGGRRDNQFVSEESSNGSQLQQPPEGRNGGPDTPIIISESNTSVRDSRHFVGSWDPHLSSPYAPPIGPRHIYDAGSGVGDVGSWSDYIRRFAVEPHDGTPHASEGDSTARSRPRRARPPRDDVAD
ncbi:hypothetical protein Salat_1869800 [Sesamum alatum]|uniref:Uncharacterized protein n=1 Tax=Sesamum alatum TaxID=300844 RepID=A0AAE1Y3J9_9LAMI|nr:hypothetical protein Salat_1869800 [Sesamum alatum]